MNVPVQPLEQYLRSRFGIVDGGLREDRDRLASDVTFARLTGVERRTWKRWQATGLNERSADRAAVNLGVHPSYIWPELGWNEGNDAVDIRRVMHRSSTARSLVNPGRSTRSAQATSGSMST